MRIGIGIDTGGTYTDAVMYDFDGGRILSAVKALTTKDDLAVGIGNALDGLPAEQLREAELIALSTTLATNACVENKGGRAKLLFISVDRWVVDWVGADYGLPKTEEIFFLGGKSNAEGEVIEEPDWASLLGAGAEWIRDACAVGVVDIDAMDNNAALEGRAREMIGARYGIPVICGSDLFSDLNSIKRGASLLLNARLVPLIADFLQATKTALARRSIAAPVVIVRSDGSLMSERFATHRPVETLLCGPAASAMGGIALAKENDCLIVDMGGTTTDIALVREGIPKKAAEGISIGRWSTFVRGLFVDTIGLGGDSAIRFDDNGRLELQPTRLVPLSVAARHWPVVTEKLRHLVATTRKHPLPVHEFYTLVRDISDNPGYTRRERDFCDALKAGPLTLGEAAQALGTDIYNMDGRRLEEEGVVLRAGLTPTDIMHLRGDFARFDGEAARLGAAFVGACVGMSAEELGARVYDVVKKKLYTNIVRVLLEDRYPSFRGEQPADRLEALISDSWEAAKNGSGASAGDARSPDFLRFGFRTPAALVGIGAPIHIFLPDVAAALHTRCVIPENAGVANALGAILGNITATSEIVVKPQYDIGGLNGYIVFGKTHNSRVDTQEEATTIALREAEAEARAEAARRGATGDITVRSRAAASAASAADGSELVLSIKAVATAIGRVRL
jgi:N-methylhydantoinase A/oxoprolinase/acetone carboxylase beta subunit